MSVTLGTIAGKTTGAGRVVRVASAWSGNSYVGSSRFKEYYYQVS